MTAATNTEEAESWPLAASAPATISVGTAGTGSPTCSTSTLKNTIATPWRATRSTRPSIHEEYRATYREPDRRLGAGGTSACIRRRGREHAGTRGRGSKEMAPSAGDAARCPGAQDGRVVHSACRFDRRRTHAPDGPADRVHPERDPARLPGARAAHGVARRRVPRRHPGHARPALHPPRAARRRAGR